MRTTHAGALMPHIPAPDPSFASVVLLLHFDNDDEQSYPDFSSYHRTTTQSGLIATDTVDPKFGAGAGIYDGTNYLECAFSADFGFAGDWTIECWAKRTGTSFAGGQNIIFSNNLSDGTSQLRALYYDATTGKYGFQIPGGVLLAFTDSATLNTWVFIAVTRQGTTVRCFQDGILQASQSGDLSGAVSTAIYLGGALPADWGSNHGFVGELDEFRITNGVARYTADFTPPTAPFPNE
jgi:hypothetical protein